MFDDWYRFSCRNTASIVSEPDSNKSLDLLRPDMHCAAIHRPCSNTATLSIVSLARHTDACVEILADCTSICKTLSPSDEKTLPCDLEECQQLIYVRTHVRLYKAEMLSDNFSNIAPRFVCTLKITVQSVSPVLGLYVNIAKMVSVSLHQYSRQISSLK